MQTGLCRHGLAGLSASVAYNAATGGTATNPGALGSQANSASAVPQAQLSEEQRDRNQKMIDLIRTRNPYQLSEEGTLTLPGLSPIALAGLTDDDATLRLKAEPAFSFDLGRA